MVSIKLGKDGEIIIKGVHTKKYVTPNMAEAQISALMGGAIANVMGKKSITDSDISDLQKNKKTYAAQLAGEAKGIKAKGTPSKNEEPKESKKGEKKETKEKKGGEKKTLPIPMTGVVQTVEITSASISNTLNIVTSKSDSQIKKQLEKLAGSFDSLSDYVNKKHDEAFALLFSAFYKSGNSFDAYLNNNAEANPDFNKLLTYIGGSKNGLTKSKTEMVQIAKIAIVNYIADSIQKNDNLKEEIANIRDTKNTSTQNGQIFLMSLLCLRRMGNEKAEILNLTLAQPQPAKEKENKIYPVMLRAK